MLSYNKGDDFKEVIKERNWAINVKNAQISLIKFFLYGCVIFISKGERRT